MKINRYSRGSVSIVVLLACVVLSGAVQALYYSLREEIEAESKIVLHNQLQAATGDVMSCVLRKEQSSNLTESFRLEEQMLYPGQKVMQTEVVLERAESLPGRKVSVISDRKTNFKGGFNSPTNYPLFSILDASLTKSVSEFQTCCGLVDIISHSFERYFCKSEEYQVCDLFALGVIRNIVDLTPKLLMNLNDEDLRKAMMETGSVSHNGFTSFGKLTSMPCHFVEHLISGKYPEIAHGLGLSWLLGPFMRRNYEVLKDKIKKFGHFVFDEDDPKVALDKFDEYINSLPFNKTMEDFGITSTEKEYYLSLLKPAL